jgi:Flp pilus assembly protein TadD
MRPSEPRRLLRYLEARPDDARALQTLGKWYRRRGRRDEARDAWERSLRADPCDPFTHLFLGDVDFDEGDMDAALERFRYAAMLAPDDPAPLWCEANVHEALGRQDLAEACHRRAVALDPADEQAVRLMEEWRERRRDGSGLPD